VWAQKTIADLKAALKIQALENGELVGQEADSHLRAIAADQIAADALKELRSCETHLKVARNSLEEYRLELATLRGYTQRINQTDNAMNPPVVPAWPTPNGGPTPTPEPPKLKFGLPVVGTFNGCEIDPSSINEYMRYNT
jgi:hypothetical protein